MKKNIKIICSLMIIISAVFLTLSLTKANGFLEIIIAFCTIGVFLGFLCSIILFLIWVPELRVYWKTPAYKKKRDSKIPCRLHTYIIIKRTWMDYVYNDICMDYLKGKKNQNHTIEMMKNVLFLMQYDSLKELNRSFLYYKVYIDNGNIEIAYLSDLFDVKGFHYIPHGAPDHTNPSYSRYMYIYKVMMKKYIKMDEDELTQEVQSVLEKETLPKKYFCFQSYKNRFHRAMARGIGYVEEEKEDKHFFLGILKTIVFAFFSCIIAIMLMAYLPAMLAFLIRSFFSYDSQMLSDMLGLTVLTFVPGIPWIMYMINKYKKPTKYEEMKKRL